MKSFLAWLIGNPEVKHLSPEECIFCRIISGTHHDSKTILYEDETLVVFPDISPCGKCHLQVVPKKHILNVDSLQEGRDYDLAVSMLEVGKQVLEKLHPGGRFKFGYHMEPFHSVLHLHMHAFVLPHKTWRSWLGLKYSTFAPWWLPADVLVERLKPKQ